MLFDEINYLGIPYVNAGRDRKGVDCWGIIRLIYSECLSISLFDLGDKDLESYDKNWPSKGHDYISQNYHHRWGRVENPQLFDLVMIKNKRNVVDHVGMMIDGQRFIQCLTVAGVVISKLASLQHSRLDGFLRYRND